MSHLQHQIFIEDLYESTTEDQAKAYLNDKYGFIAEDFDGMSLDTMLGYIDIDGLTAIHCCQDSKLRWRDPYDDPYYQIAKANAEAAQEY